MHSWLVAQAHAGREMLATYAGIFIVAAIILLGGGYRIVRGDKITFRLVSSTYRRTMLLLFLSTTLLEMWVYGAGPFHPH